MAVLRIPDEKQTITDPKAIAKYLSAIGIHYEQWEPAHVMAEDAPEEEVLETYADEIEKLKESGGYITADVIDVNPKTPNLEAMLAKFDREHWHDEDEVRFIIQGRGLFHIKPSQGPVVAIEVAAGDLIRVPRGTRHWFNLCGEREIRAIRLFQDAAGWTPRYTDSGVDKGYEPVCLGPQYIPSQPSKN
ncbi:MAG: cupin domain-containing protein [Deltaproteobacteria bacterium]|nr:cupin domain-containing protein [Deltaproteobacteria bacterium]